MGVDFKDQLPDTVNSELPAQNETAQSEMPLECESLTDVSSAYGSGSVEVSDMSLESDNILSEGAGSDALAQGAEQADQVLRDFKGENWEQLSLDDRKNAIYGLADYNAGTLGLENKPGIEYYNNEDPGDFGGYSEADNVIYINEYNLYDSVETADTIAHEMRHCYQHERAMNPASEQDHLFRENFNNYIPAQRDYDAYQQQLVESDAREYAQQFKDHINRL